MSKPQWLRDREAQARRVIVEPEYCRDCVNYGCVVRHVRYKNKEKVELRECAIHPKCFNTKYSICCEDFTRA